MTFLPKKRGYLWKYSWDPRPLRCLTNEHPAYGKVIGDRLVLSFVGQQRRRYQWNIIQLCFTDRSRLNQTVRGRADSTLSLSEDQSLLSTSVAKWPLLSKLNMIFWAVELRVSVEFFRFGCAGMSVKHENKRIEAKKASITRACPFLSVNSLS